MSNRDDQVHSSLQPEAKTRIKLCLSIPTSLARSKRLETPKAIPHRINLLLIFQGIELSLR
jgi:hypothetical protein